MSDLNAAIYSILSTNGDILGDAEDRIYPDAMEQNSQLPAIAYWRVSGRSENTINGSVSGLARARVTVESYGVRRDEVNATAEYVRIAMINARGTYAGVKVRNCLVDTHQQAFVENPTDGNSQVRYVTSQDFTVHYIEDVI